MKKFFALASMISAFSLTQACALNGGEQVDQDLSATGASAEAVSTASDDVLKAKLAELISGASFTSESDYPYVVLQGEGGARVTRLSASTLRKRLGAAILASSEGHRDIRVRGTRAVYSSFSEELASAEADAADATLEEDPYRIHARKLAATLKYMKANLRGTASYTFGTNDSGDGDGNGNVLIVYVGISKTTGKLIAIMTEAVYT